MSSPEATPPRVTRISSGAPRDVRRQMELLGDGDWQTRRAASAAIVSAMRAGELPAVEADDLVGGLIEAIGDVANAGRRAAATATLELIADRALPRVVRELASASPPVRVALAGVVGAAGGGGRAVEALAALANDSDTNAAVAAIIALGHTHSSQATPILLDCLKRDAGNDWLRFAAIIALGELGDERSVSALESLLNESATEEAAAVALAEHANLAAAQALANHLRRADGTLNLSVLRAFTPLVTNPSPALPAAIGRRLQGEVRRTLRAGVDDKTLDELARLTTNFDPALAHAATLALGSTNDARAVEYVSLALARPATMRAARAALASLARDARCLRAMLASDPNLLPRAELAHALSDANTSSAVHASLQLCAQATDASLTEASAAALRQNCDWLRRHADELSAEDRATLTRDFTFMLASAPSASASLAELTATLGALAAVSSPCPPVKDLLRLLPAGDEAHAALARLAFLDAFKPQLAREEAARLRRHESATVREAAIDVCARRASTQEPGEAASLATHLTDEAAGVRRAAVRALRAFSFARDEHLRRLLFAALADEDIWVRAETLTTLGALFGNERDSRNRLREHLAAPHPLCRVAAAEALTAHRTPLNEEDWRALRSMAQRDSQPEGRRAAVLAFRRAPQARPALSVARRALRDVWVVRRAAVALLSGYTNPASSRLLLEVASDEDEHPLVRGAALRALAARQSSKAIELACRFLTFGDAELVEDAYASLKLLRQTHARDLTRVCAAHSPRAAAIASFVCQHDGEADQSPS